MSCSSRPRSAAVTQPAPYATSASVFPVHMRDAEAVTDDRHAGAADARASLHRGGAPERRGLEHAADVARRDVAEERRQRVVELRLVARVAVEREAAVLPGGRIVHAAAA